jgi:Asp-tRNA(Asn)/Glu-tRNA(Gln) amidotransferase B subunit
VSLAKIDKVKLSQMLQSGKPQRECAKVFGVTEGAISQVKKELNLNVIKSVALENAHRVVTKNLNSVEQLQKINDHANELLDLLMRWNRGDEEALQILESQVRKVKVRDSEEEISEYKFKDPRELALKAMAEIRGQLKLQLEIFQALYDMKAVEEFQKEVLNAIGEADPETRSKIICALQNRRAIRSTLEFAG